MTLQDFRAIRNDKSKKHKYGAIRCESNGIKFPSKLEKMYYERLLEEQKRNGIDFFLRQVPFALPGNTKYIVDFVIFYTGHSWNNTAVQFVDVKGKMLPMAILKIKQVEALYPIKIKIVDAKYLTQNNL